MLEHPVNIQNRPVAKHSFFELLHVSDYQSCKWFFTTVVIAKGGEFKSRQSQRPKSNDDDNDERTTQQKRSSVKPKELSRQTQCDPFLVIFWLI